jgi:FlaA1/EpsC-like NDP-sugar epimerase
MPQQPDRQGKSRWLGYLLWLGDLVMLQVSYLAAVIVYHKIKAPSDDLLTTLQYFVGLPNLAITAYWILLLGLTRLLKSWFPRTFYGEMLCIFNTVSFGIVVMLFATIDSTDPATFFSPSKVVIFTYWLTLIVTLSFNRIIYFGLLRHLTGEQPEVTASVTVVQKKLFLMLVDLLLIAASYYLAFMIRFEGDIPPRYLISLKSSLPVVVIIRFSMLLYFNLYSGYYRYASINDLTQIIKAVTAGSVIVVVPAFFIGQGIVPRGVFVIDWLLLIVVLGGSRFMLRSLRELLPNLWHTGRRTFIIGAGSAGEMLLRELKSKTMGHRPVGLIDDDPSKHGMRLHGVPVLGGADDLPRLARKYDAAEAIIAIPSATGQQMRRLVDACRRADIEFKTIPSLREIIEGKVGVHQVRTIRVDDLLGREPVRLNTEQLAEFVSNKHVLVTGGGGSIGSEICRQLIRFRPGLLTVVERAENRLYEIATELSQEGQDGPLDLQVADINDIVKLDSLFANNPPDVIFHAAAYKQVPLMEEFPEEAVRTNIFGTQAILELADKYGVGDFVFISTDKAVRPTSVMGASKRVAELLVQEIASHSDVSFITVRFGNVLGSDGSVVPLFQRQIERGGPVTVTHPDVTRYFMTISEAALLVMQAAAIGHTGDIMVLNMGEPVKIVELAKSMITLSGAVPDKDIEIIFTGLRPGEKLEEELFIDREGLTGSAHEKILIARPADYDRRELTAKLRRLEQAAAKLDRPRLKQLLAEIVPEYRSPAVKPGSQALGGSDARFEVHPGEC